MVEGLRIGANALKEGLRNSLTILGSGEQLGLCSIRQTGYLGQNCRHFRTDEHRKGGRFHAPVDERGVLRAQKRHQCLLDSLREPARLVRRTDR